MEVILLRWSIKVHHLKMKEVLILVFMEVILLHLHYMLQLFFQIQF